MIANNVVALVLFGALCCVTGQQYQRGWSGRLGGHVQYDKNNFRFKGSGYVDRGGNWGAKASFGWRFRRSQDQPSDVFYLRIEADPCQFIVYDRNLDDQLTRDEVMSVFPDANLGEKLFNNLDVIEKDGIVTRREFDVMAPRMIAGCVPQSLTREQETDED